MPPLTPSRRSVSEGNVAAAVAVDGSSGSNKSTNNKSVSSSIHLEAENQSLKQQLAAKEEDCRMAALLGQSLLSEIEKIKQEQNQQQQPHQYQKSSAPATPLFASTGQQSFDEAVGGGGDQSYLDQGLPQHHQHHHGLNNNNSFFLTDDLSRCSTPDDQEGDDDDVYSDSSLSSPPPPAVNSTKTPLKNPRILNIQSSPTAAAMNTNASASAGTRLISSPHPPPLSVTKYARPSPQSLRKRHGQLRQLNPSASSSSSSLALQPVSPSPSSRAISIKQEGGGGSDYSLNNINYGHASNNPFSSTSISAATATASAAESKNSQSLVFEEDHPHFPSNISSSSSSSLAAQIDDVMAQHVRLLQSKLSQSESVRAELSDRLKQSDQRYDKLKRHAEKRGMTAQAIRQLDEKLWESQLANEQLRNDLSMADAAAVKHSSENKKLTLQLAALQEQIDTLTQTQEQLTDSLDKVSGRAESEHGAHGRAVAALQQEKMELQRRLDDRDVQLEDLKHQQQFLLLQQQQKGNHETGDNQDNTVSSLDPRPRNNSTSKYPPQTIPPSDFQAHIQRYEESIRNFTHSLNQSRSQVTLLQSELDAARAEADELRSMLCEAQETIEALHLESTTDALGGELIEGILESGLAQQFLKSQEFLAAERETQTIWATDGEADTTTSVDQAATLLVEKRAMRRANKETDQDATTQTGELQRSRITLTKRYTPTASRMASLASLSYTSSEHRRLFHKTLNAVDMDDDDDVYTSSQRSARHTLTSSPTKASVKSPVEALTHTMIGSWFQKFNRHGRNPVLRFFWVNPYSLTLNWAAKPPSQGKRGAKVKTALITELQWDMQAESASVKTYPPDRQHALRIRSADRWYTLIPTTWTDHALWIKGLTLMLAKRNSPYPTTGAGVARILTKADAVTAASTGASEGSEVAATADGGQKTGVIVGPLPHPLPPSDIIVAPAADTGSFPTEV